MLNACEPLSGRAAHPLGGAVSTQQLRVLLLKVQQLPVEPVVNGIFEFRCIQHVIGVGSTIQQLPQFGSPQLLLGRGRHRCWAQSLTGLMRSTRQLSSALTKVKSKGSSSPPSLLSFTVSMI